MADVITEAREKLANLLAHWPIDDESEGDLGVALGADGYDGPVGRCLTAAPRLLRDLLALVDQLHQDRSWQPIESVPRNGVKVLTFGPDGINTGWFDPGVKGHEARFPAGWREVFKPTHWMPLPIAPVGSSDPPE